MADQIPRVDLDALESDLNALRDELRDGVSSADAQHLRRVALFGRAATVIGWATAWIFPNPLSMFAISTGIVGRWTMIAHHVTHRGYDKVPDVPEHLRSKKFASTWWRRLLDWPDLIDPEAWRHEHNTLHHYKLNEIYDPDQPEHNLGWLRDAKLPLFVKYIVVMFAALTWRWVYYPPNTMRELYEAEMRRAKTPVQMSHNDYRTLVPWARPGRDTWFRCFLPYFLLHFVLLPLPFLLIGPTAWAYVIINRVGAEVLSNLHTFLIIVPSHAGDDLTLFDDPIEGRGDFYYRQIAGSANYRTGGFLNDYMHGWLNYQIEHHVFPDMSMLQYTKAQPRVEEIARKHGLPYVQESVWSRLGHLVRVMVGTETMPHHGKPARTPLEADVDDAESPFALDGLPALEPSAE